MSRRRSNRSKGHRAAGAALPHAPLAAIPVPIADPLAAKLRQAQQMLVGCWQWLQQRRSLQLLQTRNRRLHVNETVSLGEKRFVAIIEADGARFLIGGSSSAISLLTELKPLPAGAATVPFRSVLENTWQTGETA